MIEKIPGRPTWVEIDLDAITYNLQQFRRILPEFVAIIGCVKANAYGHGLLPVAKLLAAEGIDVLAVGNVNEGVRLRRSGISTPIKVFGNTLPDAARLFAAYRWSSRRERQKPRRVSMDLLQGTRGQIGINGNTHSPLASGKRGGNGLPTTHLA